MVSILVCQLLRIKPCVVASEGVVPAFVRRMAPHLCGVELDMVTKAARQGKEAPEILKVIARRRRKLEVAGAKGGVPLAQAPALAKHARSVAAALRTLKAPILVQDFVGTSSNL